MALLSLARNGSSLGQIEESFVLQLLRGGGLLPTDQYWKEGMETWEPLSSLAASPTLGTPQPALSPRHIPNLSSESTMVQPFEPPTAKEQAFLDYLKISYSPNITSLEAVKLISESIEAPAQAERLDKWFIEKFDLYPELYPSHSHASDLLILKKANDAEIAAAHKTLTELQKALQQPEADKVVLKNKTRHQQGLLRQLYLGFGVH